MIPDRVRDAARQAWEATRSVEPNDSRGEPGELSVASVVDPADGLITFSRIVAVLEHDESTRTVGIQLATNEIEQATDLDLIAEPTDTGAPFALAIQSELYGPLFTEQLQGIVGRITDEQRQATAGALLTDGESLDADRTGAPLSGPDDPRREFKERELDELDQLVAECRGWISGRPAPVEMLDPELLLPPPSDTPTGEAIDQFIELLDALDELGGTAVPLLSGVVTLLAETALLDEITRWRTDFGLDAARVLSHFTITDSIGYVPIAAGALEEGPIERRTDKVLNPFLESQASAGRAVIDIRTARRCWPDDTEVRVVTIASGRSCRGRARLSKAA
jgi:hypothetical protein